MRERPECRHYGNEPCPLHNLHCQAPDCFIPTPKQREEREEADAAWTHFNDRVRDRMEGEYGEFTNADWHAAVAMDAEIKALRNLLRTHFPDRGTET